MFSLFQTFFPMFEKRGGAWYAWIFLQGIQEEAARWTLSLLMSSVCQVGGRGQGEGAW